MGIDLPVRHPWATYVAWAALFTGDYALTLWGARLAKDDPTGSGSRAATS